MDHLFLDLIGKPILNPPKIITIIAENFSYLEDQARFFKATLAIPTVKQLPFDSSSKILVQIGPLSREINDQAKKTNWSINQYEDLDESVCDKMAKDLLEPRNRSLIFVNNISQLELASDTSEENRKFLKLAEQLKRLKGHFVVVFYQNSKPNSTSTLLRDLEYISDAVVRAQSCKAGYFKSIWWQTIPATKTLIPAKIETNYFTCKIGKFYWSSDLLCFYERRKVAKNYDLENDTYLNADEDDADDNADKDEEEGDSDESSLDKDSLPDRFRASRLDERESTLPYTQAQNPETSRIFYYPDKEDDIDEDDPDNDLGI